MGPIRSYIAAALGSVVGLYAGGAVGALLAGALVQVLAPDAGLEALAWVVIGGFGLALGGVLLICWAALRLVSDPLAGRTALIGGPLVVLAFLIGEGVMSDTVVAPDSAFPAFAALASGVVARLASGLAFRHAYD